MACARAWCGSPAWGSNFALRHLGELVVLAGNDQGHNRQIGGQFLLAEADPQADGVEGPVPIPLIAVAPGLIGVGLGLGDFVEGHFGNRRHEVQRAVDAGNHALRLEPQPAAAEDRQVGMNRAGLDLVLDQGFKLRGLQLGHDGPGAGTAGIGDPPPRPAPAADRGVAEEDQGRLALTPCPSPRGRGETVALTPCPSPRRRGETVALTPCPSPRRRGETVALTPCPSPGRRGETVAAGIADAEEGILGEPGQGLHLAVANGGQLLQLIDRVRDHDCAVQAGDVARHDPVGRNEALIGQPIGRAADGLGVFDVGHGQGDAAQ